MDNGRLDRMTAYAHRSVDAVLVRSNILLALLMLSYSFLNLYGLYNNTHMHWNNILASSALTVCSVMILIDSDRNLVRSTGFLILGLGLFRIFTSVTHIQPSTPETLLYIALTVIGLNMTYTGYHYITGVARCRIYTVLGMITIIGVNINLFILVMQHGYSFLETMELMPGMLGMTALYIGAVCILESEPIRSRDAIALRNRDARHLRDMYVPMPGIDSETADTLLVCTSDHSLFHVVDDGFCPVESEYRFTVLGPGGRAHAVIQRWKSHDMLHMMVTDHDSGTVIHALRFSFDRVSETVDADGTRHIRLYGPNGCHVLHVLNDEEMEDLDDCI